jgi:hypothetical protein
VDVEEAHGRRAANRDHVACSASVSQMISTRRSAESPLTSRVTPP